MQLLCLNNEYTSAAVKYTIGYLLDRIGFFYKWINDPVEAEENRLLICYRPDHVKMNSSGPVLFLYKHFELEQLHNTNYVLDKATFGNENIPIIIAPGKQKFITSKPTLSSFDLIANLYYHLVRLEERDFQHPDDIVNHVENSILFKHGTCMIPIVDILCDFFQNEVKNKAKENNLILFRKSFYPQGENFGIAFTHDVDFIHAYHPLKKFILKLLIKLKIKKNLTAEHIDEQDIAVWGFDKLLPFYKKNNFRATFFFLAKYLEGWHFRYRIGSKKMKKLLSQLKSDNHEIALHPSRYAFEHPGRYAREKKKLQRFAQTKIIGMRHHYLRCLYPRIWNQAARIGLSYDAGMVHQYSSGFRAGTCHPFETFDHNHQSQTGVIEFPTAFFENTLPEKGHNLPASIEQIQALITIVKKHQGLLTILWHSNHIKQPPSYAALWNEIIRLLQNSDALILPLREHYHWFRQRREITLTDIWPVDDKWYLRLSIPPDLTRFTLLIPEEAEISLDESCTYTRKGSQLIIDNRQKADQLVFTVQVP